MFYFFSNHFSNVTNAVENVQRPSVPVFLKPSTESTRITMSNVFLCNNTYTISQMYVVGTVQGPSVQE